MMSLAHFIDVKDLIFKFILPSSRKWNSPQIDLGQWLGNFFLPYRYSVCKLWVCVCAHVSGHTCIYVSVYGTCLWECTYVVPIQVCTHSHGSQDQLQLQFLRRYHSLTQSWPVRSLPPQSSDCRLTTMPKELAWTNKKVYSGRQVPYMWFR